MQKAFHQALLLTLFLAVCVLLLPNNVTFAHPTNDEPRVITVSAGPQGASIRAVYFQPDNQRGVVGGTKGLLAYTTDGGNTWRDSRIIWSEGREARRTIQVERITPVTGIGSQGDGVRMALLAVGGPYVLLSLDGGVTWYLIRKIKLKGEPGAAARAPYLFGIDVDLERVGQFLLSEVASTDSGYKFKRSSLFVYPLNRPDANGDLGRVVPLPSQFDGVEFANVFANDEDLFLVGEKGLILISQNSGKDWRPAASPTTDKIWDIYFPTTSRGWAVGKNGTILATEDEGNNWQRIEPTNSSPAGIDFRAIRFIDACRGWIVGKGGSLLYSHEKEGRLRWTGRTSGTFADLYALSLSTNYWDGEDRPRRFTYNVWAGGDEKTLIKLIVTNEERCKLRR